MEETASESSSVSSDTNVVVDVTDEETTPAAPPGNAPTLDSATLGEDGDLQMVGAKRQRR